MVAATDKLLETQPENVIRLLRTIHDRCDKFMQDENAISIVSERYGLKMHIEAVKFTPREVLDSEFDQIHTYSKVNFDEYEAEVQGLFDILLKSFRCIYARSVLLLLIPI